MFWKEKNSEDLLITIRKRGLFFPIPGRKKEQGVVPGLNLDSVGVGYQDGYLSLCIPWGNLDSNRPAHADRALLCLNLLSTQPGVGVLLRRAKNRCDDEFDECPFVQEANEFVYRAPSSVPVNIIVKAIHAYREYFKLEIESRLYQGKVLARSLHLSYNNKKRIFEKGMHLIYPSFCPFNGEDCDTCAGLPIKGLNESFPWFISGKAQSSLKKKWLWRALAFIVPLILYWLYGLHVIFIEGYCQEFPFAQALYGLMFFAMTPLTFVLLKEPLELRILQDGALALNLRDRDYFQAFLDLNDTKFNMK